MSAPNTPRADVTAAADQLQRLDDFFQGTDAVRKRGTYIPRLEAESDTYHTMRKTAVAAPGALTRTVEGSVGRIFAGAPHLEGNGYAAIEDEWQNLDGAGTHGDVLLSKAGTFGILDGFVGVLVDAPTADATVVPLSEAGRHQPRWILYRRAQIINWRTAVLDGRVVVTRLVLSETADVEDGEWGLKTEERVRVLRNEGAGITAEVWAEREIDGRKVWVMIEGPLVYDGPDEIPFAVAYCGKMVRPFVARPPLLALCDKVIEFYQVATDIRHYERVACFPQPNLGGPLQSGERLVLGPTSVVYGDFKWGEIAGTSMDQLRQNQAERKQEIGMLGLSFLMVEKRAAETAGAKRLDASAENATIADAARGLEDGINQALVYHAAYWGIGADQAPTIALNKNLSGEVMDWGMATVLLNMRRAGELTRSEFRQILARGKIIPDEMALDDAVADAELEASFNNATVGDEPAPGAGDVLPVAA